MLLLICICFVDDGSEDENAADGRWLICHIWRIYCIWTITSGLFFFYTQLFCLFIFTFFFFCTQRLGLFFSFNVLMAFPANGFQLLRRWRKIPTNNRPSVRWVQISMISLRTLYCTLYINFKLVNSIEMCIAKNC